MKTLIHLTLAAGCYWAALTGNAAYGQTNVARTGRFFRGTGTNTSYQSFVLPLDFQKGVALDNLNGNATNLFPGLGFSPTLYHYDATKPSSATNIALRIPFNNPIAAFGSRVGGSPLYFGQDYHFGAYAGVTAPYGVAAMYIAVFRQSDFQFVDWVQFDIPNLVEDTNQWTTFLTNGYQYSVTAYGLTTTLRFDEPYTMWGIDYPSGCYHLTHNAAQTATNYIYDILICGYSAGSWMVRLGDGTPEWSHIYTLEFQQRPPWQTVLLDRPQFTGTPAPSFYLGKSLPELLTNAPPVTNSVSLAPSACTNLDASPELRRHPTLDQFVANMRRDPLALAGYVQNEIELTDAIAYNDNGAVSDVSINLGGVNRGALGAFLEKQGSPTEQCALLVYLLRQAGVPAAFVFPPDNGMKMLDTQLSSLLRMQIHGAINNAHGANGQPYTTNALIAVNYPWVAAYIGTNWVHLFPWLKDIQITEGFNLYNYMPTNYATAYQWVRDYLYGRSNILGLSTEDDTPQTLFPLFVKQVLLTNAPGVSLDDIGVSFLNRPHHYSRWTDFPRPLVVTNTSTAIESLSSSAITNVYSRLTNIFDTVSVTVSSVANPNTKLTTGTLRMVDLHNRKFLIRHEKVSSSQHRMILSLAPFRSDATNTGSFTNDAALLNPQAITNLLGSSDDALNVQIIRSRQRSLPVGFVEPEHNIPYLGIMEVVTMTNNCRLRKGDLTGICLDVGKVTPAMLRVHAQELWNMEKTLAANPSATNLLAPDVYQGTVAYLMGMAYYEKCDRFQALNERLHKVRIETKCSAGLAMIRPARDASGALPSGDIDLVQPAVDMFSDAVVVAGNGTLHPDSADDGNVPTDDFVHLRIADGSAQEHSVINHFFRQADAVSTVKLLQLAQAKSATNGQPGILQLNYYNYLSEGEKNYPTTGTIKLKNQSTNLWATITNAFASYPAATYENYVQTFITPGPVTNQSATFKGMGALLIEPYGANAAIAEKNGGYGPNNPAGSLGLGNSANLSLWVDAENNYSISLTAPGSGNYTLAPDAFAGYDAASVAYNASHNYYAYSQFQAMWTGSALDALGLASQGSQNLDFSQGVQAATGNSGLLGWLSDGLSQLGSHVADPVHSVTGEFYVNASDLTLQGPMPLTVSRNYSSLNLADNQFGYGWKLNLMPYLSVGAGGTNIYAADMDGAVLAYVRTATNAAVWLPTPAANPQLVNNTTAGAGGLVNRLRDRIVQSVNGSVTNYTLYGADGSARVFEVMTFNDGIVSQTRPYLLRWTDNRGNYYTFEYGTDSSEPEFGQVRRIQCSNGNYLGFYFDVYGHIVEAYSGDGRFVEYAYDQFGDLMAVMLPDGTIQEYAYKHGSQSVTNGSVVSQQPFSMHLVTAEYKPDGRALLNEYDSHRRVTNQWSTAGQDLNPIRTATFIYANNFNLTNSCTNRISGYTLVIDAGNHTNRFDYTNSLITRITDPLNHTVEQTWYGDNATAPGYPRSVSQRIDQRGLVTQYLYDSNGNVTNTAVAGDLTGYGTNSTAVSTALYNSNCLPVWMADPVGNSVSNIYDSTYAFLPQQVIKLAGFTPVSTDYFVYGSVTEVAASGSLQVTNRAFGLLTRSIRAYNSPDAATNDLFYNGQGFVTNSVQYTGTGDPAVSYSLFYNERNELVERDDAGGRAYLFFHDDMGRPIGQETYDAGAATPMDWEYRYYNDNGELNWIDGPRYNPEDYVYFEYDGAGRKIEETHWRSQGNRDGSGVSAVPGDGVYATTFWRYDPLGNPTNIVDPLGNYVVQTFDAIGELTHQTSYSSNGAALATSGFAYEAGGLVAYETNALGGVTHKTYTATGKITLTEFPDGSAEQWNYDLAGRVMRHTVRKGHGWWATTYDDGNRRVINTFHRGDTGAPLATNVMQLDRRGNTIQRIDELGNAFTNLFDGLDRIKLTAGPPIVTVTLSEDLSSYITNVSQQVETYLYDNCGRVLTVSNVLGDRTVTTSDPLGRPIQVAYYNSNSATPVRVTSTCYSFDHHSVIVTNGTGANAIVTKTFTDTADRPVLTLHYPTNGVIEYTWQQFDANGNRVTSQQLSTSGGTITTWATNGWTYDGLNRRVTETTRDGALTSYGYDGLGDVTNRAMPGGLTWSATYNNAGQITFEQDNSGGYNRAYNYNYYAPGAYGGALWVRANIGGVSFTNSYDFWGRVSSVSTSGDMAPEKGSVTTYQWDLRGLATNIIHRPSDTDLEPPTTVRRNLDAYGRIIFEQISAGRDLLTSVWQGWDTTGRRASLNLMGMSVDFAYQADGLMTVAGGSSFGYGNNGLLLGRTNSLRTWFVNQRDGNGRILQTTTKVGAQTVLTETNTWRHDGLMSAYTAARGDFTDSRWYGYSLWAQRLAQESFSVGAGQPITNIYTTDNGQGGGLGLLTGRAQSGGSLASWSATSLDGFARIASEQNSLISRSAYGLAPGAEQVSATLDGKPLSVQFNGAGRSAQWWAYMDLPPGSHTLQVSVVDPSGLYSCSTNSTFACATNSGDGIQNSYDTDGNVVQRAWTNALGQTTRSQRLTWNAFNRLIRVTDSDAQTNGYIWTAVYDGLGRRVQTSSTLVTNGVAVDSQPSTVVDQWYDPQVEFLEVGVMSFDGFALKTYGPDANGIYGGMQGVGGLEAIRKYGHSASTGLVQDYFGNIIGTIANGAVSWNPARFSSYGPVPGYQSRAFSLGVSLAQTLGWRGKRVDETGYINLGARLYDPVAGRFMSADPLGHAASPDLYSFCGGDPVNRFDQDGRLASSIWASMNEQSLREAEREGAPAWQLAENIGAVRQRALDAGAGRLGAEYEALGYTLGTATGFTPAYEGFSSYDIGAAQPITDPVDRWGRTVLGTAGVVGTGLVLQGGLSYGQSQLNGSVNRILDFNYRLAGAEGPGGFAEGYGPVYVNPPPSATAAQIRQIQAYINGGNQAIAADYLSIEGRVPTRGALRGDTSAAAAAERARAAAAGTPYQGHAGHVPDTTWTGNPQPFMWLDLDPAVNLSIGGQANRYPFGYTPTEFIMGPEPWPW